MARYLYLRSAGACNASHCAYARSNPLRYTELTTGKRVKGGTSTEEILMNVKNGREIVRHTMRRVNGAIYKQHHRPNPKQARYVSIGVRDSLMMQMFVLDVMQDDIEDLSSVMLHLGQWREVWPRDFTEPEIVDALRALPVRGWISALELRMDRSGQEAIFPVTVARTSEEAIRSHWFQPTQVGRDAWHAWEPRLEPAE